MDTVSSALEAVPRAGFLPRAARKRAEYDGPVDIGHGQTNSQPRTVENMLRLLDVRAGHRTLDVGSGSGWTTALLAHLTGPTGSVLGVEAVQELTATGSANLREFGQEWASIEPARPGVLGLPDRGPFDRILVSAQARDLPHELVEQLADDGRLVIPVAGTMLLVVRSGAEVTVTRHGSYRFVPLRTGPAPETLG
ncbi:MAG: protein-L-isoaspartate O-methyltransferase family protein [Nocardioides sp.]